MWTITCIKEGEWGMRFTKGETYRMELCGFLLFSVEDDSGATYVLNEKQITTFFTNGQ